MAKTLKMSYDDAELIKKTSTKPRMTWKRTQKVFRNQWTEEMAPSTSSP